MAWEKRGNHKYYYHKKKIDGRVISLYLGRSSVANAVAIEDQKNRQKQLQQALEDREHQARQSISDSQVVEAQQAADLILESIFLKNGYHTHKGQWRKIRI